jgi:hypothetical protein
MMQVWWKMACSFVLQWAQFTRFLQNWDTTGLHGNLLGDADSLQEETLNMIKEMACKPYVVVVWMVDACCFDVCVCDNAAQDKEGR